MTTQNLLAQKNIPKLRFREFSNEWEECKMKEITSIITNGFVGKATDHYVEDGGVLYIQGYNVNEKGFNLHGIKYVSEAFHAKNKKSRLMEGDLLTIQTGDVGVTTVVPKELEGSNCHALIISRYIPEVAYSRFYHQYFNSTLGRRSLKVIETGSTMKHLNCGDMNKLQLPFPSFPEQQKIASFLSSVDDKIAKLTEKKKLLETYKKGVMQKIFSREIRFKDCNGEEFVKWEEKALGKLGEIITGKTPSTSDESLWKGDIQFVTPTDIDGYKYQTKTQRTVTGNLKMKILPPKSIMFTCIASIGKMSLSVKHCITNQQINSIIPYIDFDNEFIYYAILQISDYIKSTQSSNTLPIINKTEFSKFIIRVPEILEQQKIASFLTEIDTKIGIVGNELEEVENWKKGLLQEMLI